MVKVARQGTEPHRVGQDHAQGKLGRVLAVQTGSVERVHEKGDRLARDLASALARSPSCFRVAREGSCCPAGSFQEWLTQAKEAHFAADELARQLERAVKDAGSR
jgi:hypothetical protein